jgi:hypothetical protein
VGLKINEKKLLGINEFLLFYYLIHPCSKEYKGNGLWWMLSNVACWFTIVYIQFQRKLSHFHCYFDPLHVHTCKSNQPFTLTFIKHLFNVPKQHKTCFITHHESFLSIYNFKKVALVYNMCHPNLFLSCLTTLCLSLTHLHGHEKAHLLCPCYIC